jgi:hypothetical protein
MKIEDYKIPSERVDNGLPKRRGLPFLLFLDYVFNSRLMHSREAIHP